MASIFELAQQINRQKQQSAGGDQYFDNAMQVMQILDRKDKEKTARNVKSMETMLGDFQTNFDNATLQGRLDTFE